MKGTLKYGWTYNFKTNEILSPLPGEMLMLLFVSVCN